MDKDVLIKRVEEIKDPYKEKLVIYSLLDELQISYKKTNCKKCILDYYNIIKEELGMIESAAEKSQFNNHKYIYLKDRAYNWSFRGRRVLINQNTSDDMIDQFVKTHKGFYRLNTEYK